MSVIPQREPDGEFHCFQTWVNKACSWIGGTNSLCVDARGRVCKNGGDMKRADEDVEIIEAPEGYATCIRVEIPEAKEVPDDAY